MGKNAMKAHRTAAGSIDDYVAAQPKAVQTILKKIRAAIRKAAPGADETISYQIPAFTLEGRYLVYVAAFKNHIGLYPAPAGDAAFRKEVSAYRSGKASVRLPLDEPIPFDLIGKLVTLRAKENKAREKAKASPKKKISKKAKSKKGA